MTVAGQSRDRAGFLAADAMSSPRDPYWGSQTKVAVGGQVFDLSVLGEGEPVLLLHGFPQSRACWTGVVPALATAGYRVIAPDQRGYSPGARPVGRDSYHIDALVGDVLGLLDALGLPSVHLVGHDWGATVSWFVAARHPDRVRNLIAVSVPHLAAFGRALATDADQRERSAYFPLFRSDEAERVLLEDSARWLRAWFPPAVPHYLTEHYLDALQRPGVLTAQLNYYRAMTRGFAELGTVAVPTTYLWGDADFALGRVGAVLCGEYVSGDYRFVELRGVGHWLPEIAPEVLVPEILARIGSRRRGGGPWAAPRDRTAEP